jgi:hypothetical protein
MTASSLVDGFIDVTARVQVFGFKILFVIELIERSPFPLVLPDKLGTIFLALLRCQLPVSLPKQNPGIMPENFLQLPISEESDCVTSKKMGRRGITT